ncbi:MAG: hypothetical protein ACOCWZ_00025 [Spirochaetota bacterium]
MKTKYISAFHSAVLSLFFTGYYHYTGNMNMGISLCGFTDTLRDIKDAISGFSHFIQQITRIVETISDIVGIQVLLLLFFVSIIASGLAAIGVPRGKMSFFLSLILNDCLWVLWNTSFHPHSYAFIYDIARTNLILLSPYLLLLLVRRYWPDIKRFCGKLRDKILSRPPDIVTLNEFFQWKKQYQSLHVSLLESLDNDLARKENDFVTISKETIRSLDSLDASIQHFTKKS